MRGKLSRVRGKSKRAARALLERQRTIKRELPCSDCFDLREQLRVAHVSIKYLQQQMVKMASKLVAA